MNENSYRRRRRRLKPNVKRALILIVLVAVVLSTRPWRLIALPSDEKIHTEEIDTVQIPLNQLVHNSDSDIPEAIKFDKAVNDFMRQWNVVGASLAIMKDGNLIYSKGYGLANRETNDSTEVKHLFRIASVSKLITATAIMKLCDRGLLSLHSTVFGEKGVLKKFTGYTDKRFEKITIEHLLRHKGGFTLRAGDPMFDAYKLGMKLPVSANMMMEYLLGRGLGYTPGSRSVYSNAGYMILSQVVEQIASTPYEKYVKDSILSPIGCIDIHMGSATDSLRFPNEVRYYEEESDEKIPAADGSGRLLRKSEGGNNIALLSGAGGWVASPVELLRLVSAIDDANPHHNILSKESIRKMTTYDKGNMPLGWSNVNNKGDWWRSGSMAGTSAMLRRQSNGYTWVLVTNTSSWKGARFSKMINNMLQRAFGKVTEWPEKDLFQTDSMYQSYEN